LIGIDRFTPQRSDWLSVRAKLIGRWSTRISCPSPSRRKRSGNAASIAALGLGKVEIASRIV